jgi:UDP-N-acetylglucosamine 2-epimerase (non-hydrolysing)
LAEERLSDRLIYLVAGARPNFMKVAPLIRALRNRDSSLPFRLVHTGQHYDEGMSDVFFEQLHIPPPDVYLGVGSGTHGAQTARVLAAFEELLLSASPRPRGVVVVGDVNSTAACTLAAIKLNVEVAHVEAGLRSFDRSMPEEINRIVTDAIATLLLVSEESGVENLRREGVDADRIKLVGNVMIDTLAFELANARSMDMPRRLGIEPRQYALVTLHRPANVDHQEKLKRLVEFLERISERLTVVFPIHPRTRERLNRFELYSSLSGKSRIMVSDPLGYHEAVGLLDSARVVLTDSGGIQEEASYLGVPCLTLRPNTERPATVNLGTNTIIGDDLVRADALVDDIIAGQYKRGGTIPLWDGHAAERIVDELVRAWT